MDRKDRILLVDDEVNILHALKRLLRREGYELKVANSGEEGLAILQEEPVDLIISDQRMPGLCGIEFLEKAQAICPQSVRIVLSGYTDIDSVTDAINRGHVFKFILKPWDDNDLKAVIREALQFAHLQRRNKQLTQELKDRNKELQWLNDHLEEKVAIRTQELELRNTALENFQYILHQMPIGVVGVGDDGLIAFANNWAQEHLVASGMILLNQHVAAVFGADLLSAMEELAQGEAQVVFQYKRSVAGPMLEVRGAAVRYPHGASGYVFLFIEQSETKEDMQEG